jgi:hypothetical protein
VSARFPGVDWYCDDCNADLGGQSGFDDNNQVWECAACGHDNLLSENVIFDPWEFLASFDRKKFGSP